MYKVKISVPESYRFEFNKIYASVCKENNIQMRMIDSSSGEVPDTTKRVGAPNKISYPIEFSHTVYKCGEKRGLFGIKKTVLKEEVVKFIVGDIYEIHNMKMYVKTDSIYNIQPIINTLFPNTSCEDEFCRGTNIDEFVESISIA